MKEALPGATIRLAGRSETVIVSLALLSVVIFAI
jgi:hypothetical protein